MRSCAPNLSLTLYVSHWKMFLQLDKERNEWTVAYRGDVHYWTSYFMFCPLWSDQQHAINGVNCLQTYQEKVNQAVATEYAFIIYWDHLLVSFSLLYYSEITARWASAAQRYHGNNQFSPEMLPKKWKTVQQFKYSHLNSEQQRN